MLCLMICLLCSSAMAAGQGDPRCHGSPPQPVTKSEDAVTTEMRSPILLGPTKTAMMYDDCDDGIMSPIRFRMVFSTYEEETDEGDGNDTRGGGRQARRRGGTGMEREEKNDERIRKEEVDVRSTRMDDDDKKRRGGTMDEEK